MLLPSIKLIIPAELLTGRNTITIIYNELHRRYDQTKCQEALQLMECAENYAGGISPYQLTTDWLIRAIDCLKS
jgi:hypothetical protein